MDHTLDLKTLRKADPMGSAFECFTLHGDTVFISRGHPLWALASSSPAADYTQPSPDYAEQARALLSQTDWRVVKSAETGNALSPDWLAWRASLRVIAGSGAGPLPVEPDG